MRKFVLTFLLTFCTLLNMNIISAQGDIWQPAPGTTWQWQISGTINTTWDVEMYDIDLFDSPQATIDALHTANRIVICYFSAGSYEDWRDDQADFPSVVRGRQLDNWPGERWLDIRRIDLLSPIMTARLDLAVSKGCEGVEPDNVDGYSNNTGFDLTYADQLAYNTWLAQQAHSRGLSIGLKNDLNQILDLVDDFDWALTEQCFEFEECDLLLPFINAGKAVFGVEYIEEKGNREVYCPQAIANQFSWLTKTYDLADEPPNACDESFAWPVRNVYDTQTPTLTWGRISWAQQYQLQVADNASFIAPVMDMVIVAEALPQLTTDSLSAGRYFWHVRGQYGDNTWGDWSPTDEFYIIEN